MKFTTSQEINQVVRIKAFVLQPLVKYKTQTLVTKLLIIYSTFFNTTFYNLLYLFFR